MGQDETEGRWRGDCRNGRKEINEDPGGEGGEGVMTGRRLEWQMQG
jgi:hypothetical protein